MLLHANTKIICRADPESPEAVDNAISILERDISKRFSPSALPANTICLERGPAEGPESFRIEVNETITVYAEDALGFIYASLFISEQFLDIKPFWFWMDQVIEPWPSRTVEAGTYHSRRPIVRFRGWFINDEVLLDKWSINGDSELPWRMAMESLLRCGGNMVIPGSDKNSHKYRRLASSMGLWITHHHAEPLGAELFSRAFPSLEPDYCRYPDRFRQLWEESVREQKDLKVVWCLGFRGQGDCPFWSYDSEGRYDTPEKRGRLISQIIEMQRQLVLRYVERPVFCTNLYGEVMELYAQGHIKLAEDIILISADNGFGKMVTRRRGNHTARVPSLPDRPVEHGGIYYHASFYDLQAAAHITMLPNSVDFVSAELDRVIAKNAVEYWLVNCSNVRPHVYFLDALRKKWYGEAVGGQSHSRDFAGDYFQGSPAVAAAYQGYAPAMLALGPEPDEHAGEQFYTENPRLLIHAFFRDRQACAPELCWLTGRRPLAEQVRFYAGLCRSGLAGLTAYCESCRQASQGLAGGGRRLFDAALLLQAELQRLGAQGAALFGDGFEEYQKGGYLEAFFAFGQAAERFLEADARLRGAEYGVWEGFYKNDCFADYKHTAFMLQKLMGVMRELGDSSSHDRWYREAVYAPEDRKIQVLLVTDNHMTDWELYLAFRKSQAGGRPQERREI